MNAARQLLEATRVEVEAALTAASERLDSVRQTRALVYQAIAELDALEGELSDHDEQRAAAARGPRG